MASSPFLTSDQDMLLEIQAAAERRLDAQLTAALAADQRALIFAGLLGVAAAAFTSAAVTMLVDAQSNLFFQALAVCASLGMILAMGLAVFAARPTKWSYPGGLPESWTQDIAQNKNKLIRLQELIEDYNDRILFNEGVMQYNAKFLSASGTVAVVTTSFCLIGLVTSKFFLT